VNCYRRIGLSLITCAVAVFYTCPVRAQAPPCAEKKFPYPTLAEEVRQANGEQPDFKVIVGDFRFKGLVHDADVVRARILKEIQESKFEGSNSEWLDHVEEEIVRGDFQDRGYFEVEVDDLIVEPLDANDPQRGVIVTAPVKEGEKFSTGDISIVSADPEGALLIPEAELRPYFKLEKGDPLSVDKIRKGINATTRIYGNHGFMDVTITPTFSINRKDRVVDLTFRVSEGRIYYVERFNVLGLNSATTSLLESKMPPGTLFDNRLQEEIFKLGKASAGTSVSLLNVSRINRNVETGTVDITFDFAVCEPIKN
jgi:Surface antigen variable number repeat